MRNILIVLTLAVGLSGCAGTLSPNKNTTLTQTASYSLSMDNRIDSHRQGVIAKAVKAGIPATIDAVHVEMLDIPFDTAGIRGSYTDITMMIPRNDIPVSDAVLVFMIGHELAHKERDIGEIGGHEEELVCDAWGMMVAIDLGYDPYEIISWVRLDNAPSSSTHPSDELRAKKLEEVVRQYKGL